MIELQVLTPDDWPLWRELRLAALAEAPYAFSSVLADWQGEGDREERWRARLAIPESVNLIARLDGQPAGMASGAREPGGGAGLLSMWVSPAARGRGVADRLVAAIVAWARQLPAAELRLAVVTGNDRAAAFYRRQGFTFAGGTGNLLPGGIRRDQIMVKRLCAADAGSPEVP